jgi:hypothetical protein
MYATLNFLAPAYSSLANRISKYSEIASELGQGRVEFITPFVDPKSVRRYSKFCTRNNLAAVKV